MTTLADLILAVRAHAEANYDQDGWDYLVECWEDADIAKQIGKARTVAGAIRNCRLTTMALDEQRRCVCNEIF
jgi:hypothetical protein